MLQDLMFTYGDFPRLPASTAVKARLPRLRRITFKNVVTPAAILDFLELPSDVSIMILDDNRSFYPRLLANLLPVGNALQQTDPLCNFYAGIRRMTLGRADGFYAAGDYSALWMTPFPIPTTSDPHAAVFEHDMRQIAMTAEELWLKDSKQTHSEHPAEVFIAMLPALRKIVFTPDPFEVSRIDATVQLWLRALLPRENIPCPRLGDIAICLLPGVPLTVGVCAVLLEVVTQRGARGCPVSTVRFHSLYEAQDEPSCAAVDTRWLTSCDSGVAALVREIHAQLVGGVQVAVAREFPTMTVPLIARSQTAGEWKWPVWPSLTSEPRHMYR